MNFWEAQRKARSKTALYVTYFILLTLLCATGIEVVFYLYVYEETVSFPIVGLLFALLTFIVALYHYGMYSLHGGSYVAKSMGGVLVTSSHNEYQQLLNIVHEMAIASGLPMPKVYVIPSKQINAFAAGTKAQNAAIGITEGALLKLNRDEIQGVIAHEFGHIYNQDMKISLRLAAMVMGFFFICYIALRVMEVVGLTHGGRDREQDRNKGPILMIAVCFLIAGAFMWFFASILKASVSRQREYLADACAVQFTRNTSIANALRKIEMDDVRDMPKTGVAYSHLYLSHHGLTSLFATHPPLKKRIKAIEHKETDWKLEEEKRMS